MTVKNNLKEILKDRGIKQVWLAEQVGVNRKTLNNTINNKYNPSLELALKIAEVLNMSIHDIFKLEK
ncbi:transcriptional regulator [Clostridium botulinum]|uniref:helix-turn-helix transcriptional regulator n=1 Tax=Clostridium botulinum TaxID=1491 RepID=UPI0013F12519|nr:helix-turn-helix transcriptional regulator [Clostridium botulinum]MBN3451421.1 transcriptional regulator [Clostridium botulinum]NFB64594.1 transcriptional regulator [Clostridium botulinum]NFB82132.1 transcriptional regulator [Clostridium botulinum]NFC02235.1 transcriptional regulator [Clostridium botulinum]NFC09217.1 transcriptional regulator [Clostridium botulinum]